MITLPDNIAYLIHNVKYDPTYITYVFKKAVSMLFLKIEYI